MRRRTFIRCLSGGTLWVSTLPLLSAKSSPLRFGVVTDLHYAEREVTINRYYRKSRQKLQDAIDVFNRSKLDFVIELGDFKDMDEAHDAATALRFLDDIESVLQGFHGRVYHVLGNHDMDCISKEDFFQHTRNAGKARGRNYYSFTARGFQFIVLDGNFNEDRSPYCKGNFEWQKAYLPDEELEWLRRELRDGQRPVIVFIHQLLDRFSGVERSVCLGNADAVVDILEQSGRVLAVVQGHHHQGHYSYRNGIHYWTMKAMIESDYPMHNSYAIVSVERNGDICIEGFADCESREMNIEQNKL
ncbi:MAG: metallophosphoesterase [Bacteroidaceae bacterium]|nr:metallophosphoesterase [Bacteroidaceae bacterium]